MVENLEEWKYLVIVTREHLDTHFPHSNAVLDSHDQLKNNYVDNIVPETSHHHAYI